jgi:hypothetical protein
MVARDERAARSPWSDRKILEHPEGMLPVAVEVPGVAAQPLATFSRPFEVIDHRPLSILSSFYLIITCTVLALLPSTVITMSVTPRPMRVRGSGPMLH